MMYMEGEEGKNNKFKRITKNFVTGIGNQTFFEGDEFIKARNKKASRYESRDESSYLMEDDDKSFFNQRSSMARKYENNKENYSMQVNPQHNEEDMQESFQKINEE